LIDQSAQLENAQAIFLAGHNEELRTEVARIAKRSAFPIKIIGYTDAMEKLMRAADVMVSKLGGLTTFEALASRLPIIADLTTPPMPQESQTANLLARNKAGLLLERATDLVPMVRRLIASPAEHAALRLAAAKIAIPDATRRIVHEITRKLESQNTDVQTAPAPAVHTP
jgi:UDP-N-acetylglucosamine:LPS N-acetylglucosamine transferase